MTGNDFGELLSLSMDKIRSIADTKTVIGSPIEVSGNLTVIPISKVSMGIATGGVDYGTRKTSYPQNFGGGGGTGLSITPVAFLTVGRDADVNLIHIEASSDVDKITNIIEHSPEIIEKIKSVFS